MSQSPIDVLITLDPSRGHLFDEVVSKLEAMGGVVQLRLPGPGLIGVTIAQSCLEEIRKIDGVLYVEEARRLKLQED